MNSLKQCAFVMIYDCILFFFWMMFFRATIQLLVTKQRLKHFEISSTDLIDICFDASWKGLLETWRWDIFTWSYYFWTSKPEYENIIGVDWKNDKINIWQHMYWKYLDQQLFGFRSIYLQKFIFPKNIYPMGSKNVIKRGIDIFIVLQFCQ